MISKTKVVPIRRLSIPRLELCGAYLLAQLLHHVQQVCQLPINSIHARTDSTIVLNWLVGSPQRFKTYVGNVVSCTVDLIGPERWNHVSGIKTLQVVPSEVSSPLNFWIWWNGPTWLKLTGQDNLAAPQ